VASFWCDRKQYIHPIFDYCPILHFYFIISWVTLI